MMMVVTAFLGVDATVVICNPPELYPPHDKKGLPAC